jgi:exodeoxyribonuclease V alpha subunit
MRKETGREAMTIAKVLYKVERRDLEQKIILVDEASMLSLSDAYHLIKKIPDSSRLVFLGDAGQIPSIDAGGAIRRTDHQSAPG